MVAESLCAQWQRCGCDDGAGPLDLAACRGRVTSDCNAFVADRDVADALLRGTVIPSGRETRTFLDELRAATDGCEPVELDLSGILVGTIPDQGPCTDISGAFTECLDGSSCRIWIRGPEGAGPGRYCARDEEVTGPTQRAGERCDGYVGSGCGPGLRCAPVCGGGQFDGVCVELLPLDAECRWGRDCSSGFCDVAAGSDSYVYRWRGRCGVPRTAALDAPCTTERACESGFCDGARGADRGDAVGTVVAGRCSARFSDGHECLGSNECASGACVAMRYVELHRCSGSDAPCTSAIDCEGGGDACVVVTTLRGTCGAPMPDGAPCEWWDSSACESGWCNRREESEWRCTRRPSDLPPGALCSADVECAEGRCDDRCLAPLRPVGDPCSTWRDCASRSCLGGVCAAAVCSARIDPTGHGTYWRVPPVLTPR